MVEDRRYWLRTGARVASLGFEPIDAETKVRVMELTTRLVREEPTWRSHDLRAQAFWRLDRRGESLGEKLEAARLGGAAYWQEPEQFDPDLSLIFWANRQKTDYEMLLRFVAERQRREGPRDGDRIIRSMARYRLGQYRQAIDELEAHEKADAIQNMIRALCLLAAGDEATARAVYRSARPEFDKELGHHDFNASWLEQEMHPKFSELSTPE